jgi:hypothetical protein
MCLLLVFGCAKIRKNVGIAKAYFIFWKKKYFLAHLHICNILNYSDISFKTFFFDQKTKKNDC